MSLNPSKLDSIDSPIKRANDVNDPDYQNQEGYYPYDLSHQELMTTLFGRIAPSMVLDTVPADRFVVQENTKLIRNQINGNLLSQINQYVDSFFVSLRTLYPTNYEKLIPNPTKGMDLPNAALPQVPFNLFIYDYLFSETQVTLTDLRTDTSVSDSVVNLTAFDNYGDESAYLSSSFALGRLLLLSTVLSRGQLLDHLGLQFDEANMSPTIISKFQTAIDNFHRSVFKDLAVFHQEDNDSFSFLIIEASLPLNEDNIVVSRNSAIYDIRTLSEYRSALDDIFENGHFPIFPPTVFSSSTKDYFDSVVEIFSDIFSYGVAQEDYISTINADSNPFQIGHLSLARPLAYQMSVAHYFSNDSVDNIFTSDLYMQLLRATMYPSEDGFSSEPTFLYNGVTTEFDYISAGGFYYSLISNRTAGHINRQFVFSTLMFLMRRSLRYGDYFSTARPRMLAVGGDQLKINVENGAVSPIDVTQNLLKQRYLNAANYVGSGFMPQMQAMYGVIPSDLGSKPRFISHRKIELQNQITNNTSSEQGKQTTNLVGYSSDQAFDVFIDDFGILLSVVSYDVLPVYTSGIDAGWHLTDRFDYFNPMLQNIGDQPIYLSEMCGDTRLHDDIFGYTMRNAELKFKNSRAHGAFATNELAGYLMKYPISALTFTGSFDTAELRINPDFIRDKPYYIDSLLPSTTGVSPCEYWHFIVSANNVVQCARKVQATPPVLF